MDIQRDFIAFPRIFTSSLNKRSCVCTRDTCCDCTRKSEDVTCDLVVSGCVVSVLAASGPENSGLEAIAMVPYRNFC